MTPQPGAEVLLRRNEEKRILAGHAWVFSNEIRNIEGSPEPGGIVRISRADGRLIGYGLYNPSSLIAVRIFSRQAADLDGEFLAGRLRRAAALRSLLYPGAEAYRLVHGESDGLPGLIVDRFGAVFVLQTLSLGMDRLKEQICDALAALFQAEVVVERNESGLRELEGLPRRSGILRGALEGPVTIEESGVRYRVDPVKGQKTGFFFDQRENRLALRRFASGARVLDAYCHDGAFALHLASAGARETIGIDASGAAVERARDNAALNGLEETCLFEKGNLPAALEDLRVAGRRFDLVVADPPSFTRSRKNVPVAKRAYVDLNRGALRLVESGGILATASCSHHITDETFLGCIREAAGKVRRDIRLLEWRSQGPDHPVVPAMPETRYLKFAILAVD